MSKSSYRRIVALVGGWTGGAAHGYDARIEPAPGGRFAMGLDHDGKLGPEPTGKVKSVVTMQPLGHALASGQQAGQCKKALIDAQGRVGVPVVAGRQMFSVSAPRPLGNDPRADRWAESGIRVREGL